MKKTLSRNFRLARNCLLYAQKFEEKAGKPCLLSSFHDSLQLFPYKVRIGGNRESSFPLRQEGILSRSFFFLWVHEGPFPLPTFPFLWLAFIVHDSCPWQIWGPSIRGTTHGKNGVKRLWNTHSEKEETEMAIWALENTMKADRFQFFTTFGSTFFSCKTLSAYRVHVSRQSSLPDLLVAANCNLSKPN